jgi:TRAP transporter TAXI family solute receptor
MKKLLLISLVLVLLAGLILSGCSQSAPSSAPAPATTQAPATSAAPAQPPKPATSATAPAPSPAVAPAAPQKTDIQILSMAIGTSAYLISFGLAQTINKNSTWLHAEGVETLGPVENIKRLEKDVSLRKNTIIFCGPQDVSMQVQGLPPFETKYDGLVAINPTYATTDLCVTTNPNIKTGKDLNGKRIALMPKFDPPTKRFEALINEAIGPGGTAKYDYMTQPACKDALIAGTADAAFMTGALPGGKFVPMPFFNELLGARTVYSIQFSDEVVAKAREKTLKDWNLNMVWSQIPPKTFGDWQNEPATNFLTPMGWFCDKSMSEDVIAEVFRIIYEKSDTFATFHANGAYMTKENLAKAAIFEGTARHPGVLKYLKEKGLVN